MAVSLVVPKEVTPGEKRVALVPDTVGIYVKAGIEVRVENGAGQSSYYTDQDYAAKGAKMIPDHRSALSNADIIVKVQPPTPEEVSMMKPGTIVVGHMSPTRALDSIAKMRDTKVTAFAMELVPRITRAQVMDALSSQANIGGYEAVLIGAEASPRYFPMLTTAAGTVRPAKVLILGAGVAGLQAIATAKRLGAMVTAYDVRRVVGDQVRSLGAKFLELQINAEGTGGYARELTPEEKVEEQKMVTKAVSESDVVITTANVPGKKAPKLIGKEMVALMKPGSVIVDLAAESGGNCELTKPGERISVSGVTIDGPLNLPSRLPFHASQLYSKNIQAFLELLLSKDGKLTTTFTDEILMASVLVTNGEVKYAPTIAAMGVAK
jgi:NAD(P) transhydrogenase subunit alpha